MELLLFRHSEYEKLYNCTGLDIDLYTFDQRQHLGFGISLIVLASIYFILYLPCLFSIWRRIKNSACYTMMFFIGGYDMISLNLTGIATGIVCWTGTVFCSAPTTLYIVGCVAQTCWCGETSTAVILALNRVLTFISPELDAKLFGGRRIWLWMASVWAYCAVWLFYYHPTIPSSINVAWSVNPFIRYRTGIDALYVNATRFIHNYLLIVLFPAIYACFCIALCGWTKEFVASADANSKKAQKKIFIQVFIISALNMSVASLYHSYSFIPVTPALIVFTQFLLLTLQGCCPLIYLALNPTIRGDCVRMARRFLPECVLKVAVGGATTNAVSTTNARNAAWSNAAGGNRIGPM